MSDSATVIVVLILGILLLTGVLLILVVWSKWRRDRAERASATRRRDIAAAWTQGDEHRMSEIFADCRRAPMQHQADLLIAIRSTENGPTDDAHMAIVQHAFEGSGLRTTLLGQLNSSASVRRGLAVTLGALRSTRLPTNAISPLMRDPEPTVRLAAAGTLEAHATDDAAIALIEALQAKAIAAPRIAERLGHDWAVDTILDHIHAVDDDVQCTLLDALGLASSERAIPALIDIARTSTDNEVVAHASKALAACACDANPSLLDDAAEFARSIAVSGSPVVRGTAARILACRRDPSDIHGLGIMVGDSDWFVRRQAAQALLQFGEPGANALRELAVSGDRYAAERARQELALEGLIDSPEAQA